MISDKLVKIRREVPSDYDEVDCLVKASFATKAQELKTHIYMVRSPAHLAMMWRSLLSM